MGSRIYLVAGETSGDNHGAALLGALQRRDPDAEFIGRGGPAMKALAGPRFRDWVADAAVVGLWEVIKRYRFFRTELRTTMADIALAKPDALLVIDYPGFNLRLARAVRRRLPRLKIIYYISPQVWAWNRRRISQMAQYLDLMLCIFPFEPELYQPSGLRALFVGHPMLARTEPRGVIIEKEPARDDELIALFPGSREREVRKILPIMRDTALTLRRQHPQLRFEVSAASEHLAGLVRKTLPPNDADFSVTIGDAPNLMRRARVGLVASGTATLEAALARLPFVLVYRVSWMTYLAARMVVRVKHLGMPNVLAGREIVPEFIQHRARPRDIANAVNALLAGGNVRAKMLNDFTAVRASLAASADAAENAAEAILSELRHGR